MMEQGGTEKVGGNPKKSTWNHYVQWTLSSGHCTQHRYFLFWKIWQKYDSVQSETYYTIVATLLLLPCLFYLPWYQVVSLCFQDILCLWVAISKLYILLGKLLCSIERKIPGMVQRRVLLNLLQFSIISQYHSQKYHSPQYHNIILHNITISFFSMPPVHCFHIKFKKTIFVRSVSLLKMRKLPKDNLTCPKVNINFNKK